MTLVPDTSIPFPYDAPEVWDRFVLRGQSGKLYTWPVEMVGHGKCTVKFAPPKERKKNSKKAGAAKVRVKNVGTDSAKVAFSFNVVGAGMPTFVALVRLLVDKTDGPWRILHPQADLYDLRLFDVETLPEIDNTRAELTATATLKEIDPETQAGNGASSGVLTPQAIAYNKAAEDQFIAQQIAFATQTISLTAAETKRDINAANGRKDEVRVIEKAVAFGKVNP